MSPACHLPVEVMARTLGEALAMFQFHDTSFSWILHLRLLNRRWNYAVVAFLENDCTERQPELKSTGKWSPRSPWRSRTLGYFRLFLVSTPCMSKGFLESIRFMNLAHTSITDSDLHRLAQLSTTSVRSLNVTLCGRLTKSGLKSLRAMPELESLSISYTEEGTDQAFFSKFPSLKVLTLPAFKSPSGAALCDILELSLPNLQALSLTDSSALTDQSLVALSRRAELLTLDLRECRGPPMWALLRSR